MPATKRQTRAAAAPEHHSGAQNGISAYAMPTNGSQNHANANAAESVSGYDIQQAAQDRIGDVLRRVRERHRGDLQEIAEYLRIKHSFLVALENSRYSEIPADAYVIGFLRTYAEFLGLDGKEAIDRYRKEMEGRRRKPILTMPIPIGEGRAPSAMLVAGAAMAALLVYVVWYGVSSSDRAAATAPPVIASTQTGASDYQSIQASDSNLTLQPAPAEALAFTRSESDGAAAQAGTIQSATVLPPSTAFNGDKESVQSGIAISGPPPSGNDQQKQEQPPQQQTMQLSDQKESLTSVAVSGFDAGAQSSAISPKPASRIVIRADQTSWVLISDSRGNVLLDKVLKSGTTYEVPDQQGLKMTTGNSGGLTLVIDGTSLVRLPGDSSKILRNVPLDPAHLKTPSPPQPKTQD